MIFWPSCYLISSNNFLSVVCWLCWESAVDVQQLTTGILEQMRSFAKQQQSMDLNTDEELEFEVAEYLCAGGFVGLVCGHHCAAGERSLRGQPGHV